MLSMGRTGFNLIEFNSIESIFAEVIHLFLCLFGMLCDGEKKNNNNVLPFDRKWIDSSGVCVYVLLISW